MEGVGTAKGHMEGNCEGGQNSSGAVDPRNNKKKISVWVRERGREEKIGRERRKTELDYSNGFKYVSSLRR